MKIRETIAKNGRPLRCRGYLKCKASKEYTSLAFCRHSVPHKQDQSGGYCIAPEEKFDVGDAGDCFCEEISLEEAITWRLQGGRTND